MGVPLYITCCFSLDSFNSLSLPLTFVILITVCLGIGLILYGTLHFPDLGDCFLSQVREVFSYYLFKYVISPFLSLLSFWDPYNVNISAPDVVLEVSHTVFISFYSFFSVQRQ